MTINPHPYVLTAAAEQRHAEFLALAERDRMSRRAVGASSPRPPWADRPILRTLAAVLALVLTIAR
jgi:hypothetical protein